MNDPVTLGNVFAMYVGWIFAKVAVCYYERNKLRKTYDSWLRDE